MRVFSRLMFGVVQWKSRNGLARESASSPGAAESARRQTGARGEALAYWYLRRHGYTMVARNFTVRGVSGEIDMIGYDREVLAFVEVKTRVGEDASRGLPEDAVTPTKRRILSRMARQFLAERRIREIPWRFDVVAIDGLPGHPPSLRLHKGAFADR